MTTERWIVFRAIASGATAIVLLAAAFFKLQPLLSDLFHFHIFELVDTGIVALVIAEVGAALLLLSSPHRRQSWLVGLLLFVSFFVAATVAAIQGHRSCGCLGELSVVPWAMATLDAVIVLATSIALWSLPRSDWSMPPTLRTSHCLAMAALFPIASGLLFLSVSKMQSTGLLAAPALVAVEHNVKVVSRNPKSDFGVVSVLFCNPRSRPIRVAGVKVGCDTRVVSQLPFTLAPGASASLEVATRIPVDVPRATLELLLYTSGTSRLEQPLKFSVAGR